MSVRVNTYTKVIIIISFVISTGLVLFIAMNANRHLSSMSQNNAELYSAYRISELLKAFRVNFVTLENKQNAYLVTGDPKFLEEFKQKEAETKTYLKDMEKYFSGKPEERKFYDLQHLTFQRLMAAKNLNQQNNLAGFKGKSTTTEQTDLLKEINEVIDDIDNSLSRTTQTLIDQSVEYVHVSKSWGVLEVLLGVIVLTVSLILLLRDINIRNKLEAELRIAKKQADDTAMMKEQFMANMSHEIRTPMNAILGFTDLMQKTNLDEKQAEYASAIRTSGSNLLNIINDILDFSKIEAGKLVIDRIAFNVPGLIDSLRIMFSERAKQKGIGFEVVMDPRIPEMVFGDPTRLTQILVNLTNNAIKFTDEGFVRLSCEIGSLEKDMAHMVFRVKDTGIGIPEDKLGSIFERFDQGNKETTRKYGGTGLGLAIVRDLVALQNGVLNVRSAAQQGSEFIVMLDYQISYETHTKVIENFRAEFGPISKGELNVLLVEDNELNQKLATTYLRGFGLKVDLADNGLVALEKLRKKKYDLVLMDIQMPELDGYHAAEQIRRELKLDVPIIAMTAHIMSGEKEKCISYGMNDYISKPFKEADLYELVKRYLKDVAVVKQDVPVSTKQVSAKDGVVDFKDIEEMARGNKAFIVEMIDLFLEKNPQDLHEVQTALEQNDHDAVRAISHRMKTSVGFMGLKHLGKTLSEIEDMAEDGVSMNKISPLLDHVRKSCVLAKREFEEALRTQYHEN